MLEPGRGAKRYEQFKRDLDLHPYIELAEASKLHLTSLGDGQMAHREEAFMSRILGDDPYFKTWALEKARQLITAPVRISERAYVTYLDYVRINVFAKMARQQHEYNVRKGIEDAPKQYDGIARFVNYATGRGDLGKYLNDAAPILNAVFFSPRYWASRLQVMNPVFYAKLPPEARSLAIKNMLAFVGTVGLMMALLKAAGFDVELGDEDNPDLVKLRLGNYTYEFTAGLIGHLRYAARMVMATQGGDNPKDKRTAVDKMTYLTGRYGRSKLSPLFGGAYNAATGKNYIGEPTSVKEEALGLITPIMIDNFYDAAKTDGTAGIIKMAPEFFGIGTTRYATVPELEKKRDAEKLKRDNATNDADRRESIRRMRLWNKQIQKTKKYARKDAKNDAATESDPAEDDVR